MSEILNITELSLTATQYLIKLGKKHPEIVGEKYYKDALKCLELIKRNA
ncbi:hypothetical protein J4436_03380 [Candidatus Woesearchaeota archaeon]|nr:hypothetical protein [Candidatus Woesearchaeota archaeon]